MPPTGQRARQDEHRRQRPDNAVQQCVERPLVCGHFGLIRPRTAVATYAISNQQAATVNEQYKQLSTSACSTAIAAAASAAATDVGDANVFVWMLWTTATSGDRCTQLNTQPCKAVVDAV